MLKKDDVEYSVPNPLSSKFRKIAEAFLTGDYQLRDHPISGVRPVEAETANWIADCISAHGDDLAPLSEQTWDRSISRWMDGYWMVLVDLTTRFEPVSDLSLHAKLYQDGDLEIYGVLVP